MYNPYQILNISKTATEQEIKEARKKQIEIQCGNDENKKNAQGQYIKDVINEAAKNLLDLEKRKIVDKMLGDKNLPIISNQSTNLVPVASVVVNHINNEIITKMPSIAFKKSIFHKKVECKNLYGLIGCDGSFNYAYDRKRMNQEGKEKWHLVEYFTNRICSDDEYLGDRCPWDFLQVFTVDGIKSIAYPIYRLLPNSLIYKGKVEEDALRKVYPITKQTVVNMKEEFDQLFSESDKVEEKIMKRS